jgi:hypothetical protein
VRLEAAAKQAAEEEAAMIAAKIKAVEGRRTLRGMSVTYVVIS